MKRWFFPVFTIMLGLVLGTYFVNAHLHGQIPSVPPPQKALAQPAPIATEAPAIPRELTSYRDIVKKVLPAVVSIDTKVKAVANPFRFQVPDNAPEEFRKFAEEFQKQQEDQRAGFGSGFFVDPSGVVLTNFHVVNGADQAVVHLADGRSFTSRDIRGDRRTDLAIIKLDLKGATVPYLAFADSDAAEIGDRVLAVGAPYGLTGSVTHGIVSGKGRAGFNMNMYEDFLQTDAAINPGNSGGPLVNLNGQVLGINAAIKSMTGGFQGIGLAIASNLAQRVEKALLTEGVVRRGYLGIQIRDLDADLAAKLGIARNAGVVIADVYNGTPAAKAGLRANDVITQVAGKSFKDGRTLQQTIAYLPIGRPTEFTINRDGKSQTVPVVIEEQPSQFGTVPMQR